MKVYETRYKGNRPYCVEVSDHTVEVFEQSWDATNEYWSKDRRVYQSSYERIFIGDNFNQDPKMAPKGRYPGNTVLLHLRDSEYVFIGHIIFSFSVFEGDTISEYISPVFESTDIPFPYAIGNHIMYQMNEQIMMILFKKDSTSAYPLMINVIHNPSSSMEVNHCV